MFLLCKYCMLWVSFSLPNTYFLIYLLSRKRGTFSCTFCVMVSTNRSSVYAVTTLSPFFLTINFSNTDQIRKDTSKVNLQFTENLKLTWYTTRCLPTSLYPPVCTHQFVPTVDDNFTALLSLAARVRQRGVNHVITPKMPIDKLK